MEHNIPGPAIAHIRAYHGLSIKELAHLLKVNERTIRRWESGEQSPPVGVYGEILNLEAIRSNLYFHLNGNHPLEEFDGIENIPAGFIRAVSGEVVVDQLDQHTYETLKA